MHKKTTPLDLPPLVTIARTRPGESSPARPLIDPRARILLALLALLLLASVARGATTTYEVLLDLDLNAQTGCTISTPKGSVGGIEQALVTTVVTDTGGGSVSGVARRVCTAAVLGAPLPVDAGGWPVGFGNGTLGSTVIETYIPRAALGQATSAAAAVRVTGDGGGGDAIVGPEGGSLPTVSFAPPGNAVPQMIPLLSPWALVSLALLLGVLASRTVRRGDALGMLFAVVLGSAVSALVWAATVILDGNVGDWSGVQPSATDAIGNAQPNGDLVALFTQSDQQRVYFRIDADLGPEVQLEQSHVCLGGPALAHGDPDRYVAFALNTMLGGSMSSRLFQNVRERRALAYSVFSSLSSYRDTGAVTVYAGCGNDAVEELIDVVMAELRRLKGEPLASGELQRARDHLKGSLMLSLESTSSRMTHHARQDIYGDTDESLDDMIAAIDRITEDDITRVAHRLFPAGALGLTVLGGGDAPIVRAEQLALA